MDEHKIEYDRLCARQDEIMSKTKNRIALTQEERNELSDLWIEIEQAFSAYIKETKELFKSRGELNGD